MEILICIIGMVFFGKGVINAGDSYVKHGHVMNYCFLNSVAVMFVGCFLLSIWIPLLLSNF